MQSQLLLQIMGTSLGIELKVKLKNPSSSVNNHWIVKCFLSVHNHCIASLPSMLYISAHMYCTVQYTVFYCIFYPSQHMCICIVLYCIFYSSQHMCNVYMYSFVLYILHIYAHLYCIVLYCIFYFSSCVYCTLIFW